MRASRARDLQGPVSQPARGHTRHAQFASDCRIWYARPMPAALAACIDRPSLRAMLCISSRSPHTIGMACFSAFARVIYFAQAGTRWRFRSVGALKSACAAADLQQQDENPTTASSSPRASSSASPGNTATCGSATSSTLPRHMVTRTSWRLLQSLSNLGKAGGQRHAIHPPPCVIRGVKRTDTRLDELVI